jgi:HAD superfamily hydrolase (TIGR01509 family)
MTGARPTCVLFDVDGTLVDTTYIHAVTWWEAMRQHDHDVATSAIHRAIGMGSAEMLEHLLGPTRDAQRDSVLEAAHLALYATYWSRLRPIAGARDLLRRCHASGQRVVLASSASPPELDALRAALDCDDAIDAATGGADAERGKPAPDIFAAALAKVGAAPVEAVVVGDAVWDAQASGALGIPFIGLTCGGHSGAELRDAGAVEVHRDPSEAVRSRLLG